MQFLALATFAFAAWVPVAAPAPKAGPPRVLVASSKKDGNWNLYLVQASTGEVKRLTNHKANDTNPVWSPDGRQIAFLSDRGGSENIWTIKLDGSDLTQLTKEKERWFTQLRWSPDGLRIAYVCGGGDQGLHDVHVVEAATGKVRQLSKHGTALTPSWSPDGKRLAYSCVKQFPDWHVRAVNADGTGEEKIADEMMYPCWSPDGKRIACFQPVAGSDEWKVHVISADGKDKTWVGTGDTDVQWSPDGKRLCFTYRKRGWTKVVVANADATGQPSVMPESQYARWSPDGKSLSYVRQAAPGRFVLTVSDPDGTDAKDLLTGVEAACEWQPK